MPQRVDHGPVGEEVLDGEQQGAGPAADRMQPVVPLHLWVGAGPPPVLALTQQEDSLPWLDNARDAVEFNQLYWP